MHAQLCPTLIPRIIAHRAPLSMEFSRQKYWSGLPCPSPWYLPDPGVKSTSLASPSLAGRFFTTGATWKAPGGSDSKESACNAGEWARSLGQGDPLEKGMATYSSFLPGKFHGQRSLANYSPLSHKESDTTEQLTHT